MSFNRSFIISKEERIVRFLSIFGNKIELSFAELMNKAKDTGIPSGGSFSSVILDSKVMKLISNGGKRYSLTELGKHILSNPSNREFWKEAYLNVPLYRKYNSKFPNNQDYNNFIKWAGREYRIPKRSERLLNMGVRRFFEGFYCIKLPFKLKKKVRETMTLPPIRIGVKTEEDVKQPTILNDELFELMEVLKKAKKKYDENDLKRLLEVL